MINTNKLISMAVTVVVTTIVGSITQRTMTKVLDKAMPVGGKRYSEEDAIDITDDVIQEIESIEET